MPWIKPKQQPRYKLRYERSDGAYREISLRASSEAEARELAGRRLVEQFEDQTDYSLVGISKQ